MKKTVLRIFAAALLCGLLLSGCGNSDNTANDKENSSTVQADTKKLAVIKRTLSAGEYCSTALRSDGTAISKGFNLNPEKWNNLSSISAESHIVGLKSDGTVISEGDFSDERTKVSDWSDMVDVFAGWNYTLGLRADSTVIVTKTGFGATDKCFEASKEWTDIVQVSGGFSHIVGLRSDGTVVAAGKNSLGECDVSTWSDIVSVSAGGNHTLGLRSDGTVVAVGQSKTGAMDVTDWSDIKQISTTENYTLGLKNDGTVVGCGQGTHEKFDPNKWNDLIYISANQRIALGLKSNGTAVGVTVESLADYAYADVSDWTDIMTPTM